MNNQELLLKTIFACMACDGDIASEEVQVLRELIANTDLFKELDVEVVLKKYVDSINKDGVSFLNNYLSDIAEDALSKEEQMCLVDLAFKTIEADKRIEYSEVKFFKKIRVRLSLTDEEIIRNSIAHSLHHSVGRRLCYACPLCCFGWAAVFRFCRRRSCFHH